MSSEERSDSFLRALLAGACAGVAVDVSLYPLDTIKTRLQSSQGFIKAGGFKGVYRGISAAAIGSAPGAALFFSSYESAKKSLRTYNPYQLPAPFKHMIAAAIGETAACMVRVPTEVVKQRMQTGVHSTFAGALRTILQQEGVLGLYCGFSITIMREIPFAFIQFPIYEYSKVLIRRNLNREPRAYEAALCGSISGAVAAAATTPLDVIKTRLMLGKDPAGVPYNGVVDTCRRLLVESRSENSSTYLKSWGSLRVFFRGVEPRVMWIGIGGFVFFGAYEQAATLLSAVI